MNELADFTFKNFVALTASMLIGIALAYLATSETIRRQETRLAKKAQCGCVCADL